MEQTPFFEPNTSLDEVDTSAFRLPKRHDFDLVVIGSGPAGQKAAFTAADNGARVALIERDPLAGGVCLNTGTIPSKTLREAVLYLTGYRQRGYYGDDYRLKEKITASDLLSRTTYVIELEREVINESLAQRGVTRLVGTGRIEGPNAVSVNIAGTRCLYTAGKIIVAVGTRPRRPAEVPFDNVNIFDSDAVFGTENDLRPLPDSIIVMGAGVIGIEYACMFQALGIPTTLVDPRENPLAFVDEDVSEILYTHLRKSGAELIFGDTHEGIQITGGETPTCRRRVRAALKSGRVLEADAMLFALGRVPMSEDVGSMQAGVKIDRRGNIAVDENYVTSVPTIYAVGDVIGFPALASTSAEQGRCAALHALGIPAQRHPESLPFGLYTIPEASMAGRTEQELRAAGIPYVAGTAIYLETARGKILGDLTGALKLLFHRDDRRLLGVHVVGEGATELVHIGQAVIRFGGGLDYFLETVFNYPTLAEAYKVAAHNAAARFAGHVDSMPPLHERAFQAANAAEWAKWALGAARK